MIYIFEPPWCEWYPLRHICHSFVWAMFVWLAHAAPLICVSHTNQSGLLWLGRATSIPFNVIGNPSTASAQLESRRRTFPLPAVGGFYGFWELFFFGPATFGINAPLYFVYTRSKRLYTEQSRAGRAEKWVVLPDRRAAQIRDTKILRYRDTQILATFANTTHKFQQSN